MEKQNTAAALLSALHFAAWKHRDQRRKDVDASPYINHPIEVAEILARVGGVSDVITLQAAILHDTLEDTETTPEAEVLNPDGKTLQFRYLSALAAKFIDNIRINIDNIRINVDDFPAKLVPLD